MYSLSELYDAVVSGNAHKADSVTREALVQNVEPMELVSNYMIPAMDEVGKRFEEEEYFIPELLLSARAMKSAMAHIRPLLALKGNQFQGRVIIGTVKGDLHDIGKNLVASMLEGGGFEVIDLGVDVAPEVFADTVKEKGANLICLSTLLTTTMSSMSATLEALRNAGVRQSVKVLVGGAPVTEQFAKEIGADAYGENARTAVMLARQLAAKS